jgi:hypothetical protein
MADRHDIDALLVDAAYGTLDADGRARLDAYLISHPQERAALDAMTATRARVREARAAAPDAEPSGGISALLLQEAARRAPARKAERAGTASSGSGSIWSWLQSAMRPLVAHPALASAAALVLVGGTAGALYLRAGSSSFYEQTAAPAVALDDRATAASTTAAPATVAMEAPTAAVPVQVADGYAANLDEKFARTELAREQAKAEPVDVGAVGRAARKDARAPVVATVPDKRLRGMDVTTAQPELKTLDDEDRLAAAPQQKGAPKPTKPVAPPAAPQELVAKGAAPAADEARAESVPAPAAASAGAGAAPGGAPPTSRYDADREEQRTQWARGQHQRVVAAVKRNDCNEAAALAAEIAVRAADYYVASVSDDRAIRACKPAIERARKRDAERRAKSRAPSANEADALDLRK